MTTPREQNYNDGALHASRAAIEMGLTTLARVAQTMARAIERRERRGLRPDGSDEYAAGYVDEAIMLATLHECAVRESRERFESKWALLASTRTIVIGDPINAHRPAHPGLGWGSCATSGNGKTVGECAREGCGSCRKMLRQVRPS